jgi:hypothetical protein
MAAEKCGGLRPREAVVLLRVKDGETVDPPAAYKAPARQALIDEKHWPRGHRRARGGSPRAEART